MPLFNIIKHNSSTTIYLWKISDPLNDLLFDIHLTEKSQIRLNDMKSELHKRAFLSVRQLMRVAGYKDIDLFYDESGKPHLKDKKYISITHSHEMSAIIISDEPVGIDIEIKKEKVLKIVSKFMDRSHISGLSQSDQIFKATVVWGIKETVFKIKNIKGISFKNHIEEDIFDLSDKKTKAQLIINNSVENFNMFFDDIDDYVLVWGLIAN